MAVAAAHNMRRRKKQRDGTGNSEDSAIIFGGQLDSLGSTAASGCEQLTESVSRAMRILERMNELLPARPAGREPPRPDVSKTGTRASAHVFKAIA